MIAAFLLGFIVGGFGAAIVTAITLECYAPLGPPPRRCTECGGENHRPGDRLW